MRAKTQTKQESIAVAVDAHLAGSATREAKERDGRTRGENDAKLSIRGQGVVRPPDLGPFIGPSSSAGERAADVLTRADIRAIRFRAAYNLYAVVWPQLIRLYAADTRDSGWDYRRVVRELERVCLHEAFTTDVDEPDSLHDLMRGALDGLEKRFSKEKNHRHFAPIIHDIASSFRIIAPADVAARWTHSIERRGSCFQTISIGGGTPSYMVYGAGFHDLYRNQVGLSYLRLANMLVILGLPKAHAWRASQEVEAGRALVIVGETAPPPSSPPDDVRDLLTTALQAELLEVG